jgi:hypothetical protein
VYLGDKDLRQEMLELGEISGSFMANITDISTEELHIAHAESGG